MGAGMLSALTVLLLAASTLHLAAAKVVNGITILDAWSCGVVSEGYGIIPGNTWGSAPDKIREQWSASDCDSMICAYYIAKYSVVPGKSWGDLTPILQTSWGYERPNGAGNCDTLWIVAAADVVPPRALVQTVDPTAPVVPADIVSVTTDAPATVTYEAWECGVIQQGYEILPGVSWGSVPDNSNIKQIWADSSCDIKICAYFVSMYKVVPGKSWGTLPIELQKSWSWDRPNGGNCDNIWATASLQY